MKNVLFRAQNDVFFVCERPSAKDTRPMRNSIITELGRMW